MLHKSKKILKDILNNIKFSFYFIKRCISIGYDCAYREYVNNKFKEFSYTELQLYYQLLVSDLESRLTYIYTGIFFSVTLAALIGVGVNLGIEALKPSPGNEMLSAYNQFMITTVLFLFVTSILGFIITTLLGISSKSFGFYLILLSCVLGGVYWTMHSYSIFMDLFFLLMGGLSATLLVSTIFDGIKKSAIIKKLTIEYLLNNNRKKYIIRLPKKYRV